MLLLMIMSDELNICMCLSHLEFNTDSEETDLKNNEQEVEQEEEQEEEGKT